MYPVDKTVSLPPAFHDLGKAKERMPLKADPDKIKKWLQKWREIFS
jgi:ABC-type thiamine transport system substrate-binding protein